MLRLHGELLPVRYRALDAEELTNLLREIVTDSQWATFMAGHDLDFAYAPKVWGVFASICFGKPRAWAPHFASFQHRFRLSIP
jgi:Tfp pilus assembly pilus retraction ATPase PilT